MSPISSVSVTPTTEGARSSRDRLLGWYDANARDLPWRAPPGASSPRPDPYAVWVSEIMLQQTTVTTVVDHYRAFMSRWPDVGSLATATVDDVLTQWKGLGYYSRGRNLHRCAQILVAEHSGRFPTSARGLSRLPGIGPYTAAAIAAIAFGEAIVPVDGNVERVVARCAAIATPLPGARSEITEVAQGFSARERAGDLAQALIELGALLCRPKSPRCTDCPLQSSCAANAMGRSEGFPVKAPRRPKPSRSGAVVWLEDPDGHVLVRRRPQRGLLGGMMEFPGTEWDRRDSTPADPAGTPADPAASMAQIEARLALSGIEVVADDLRELPGTVEHEFTHFGLHLTVLVGSARPDPGRHVLPGGHPRPDLHWVAREELSDLAFPRLMTKVIEHVDAAGEPPVVNLDIVLPSRV